MPEYDKKKLDEAVEYIKKCRDPFVFIKDMYGLIPQPCRPGYEKLLEITPPNKWKAEWFGEIVGEVEESGGERFADGHCFKMWVWHDFQKGKHITWQQTAIFEQIRRHNKEDPKKWLAYLAIASGHGIGKTAAMAIFVKWFLFVFPYSQAAVTAPSKQQMYDVLWKELSVWLGRMPSQYSQLYELQSNYLRMKSEPLEWFARAATARKDNAEALAGIHAKHVLLLADEASGVDDAIYQTAEGALSSGHIFFILISNPTKLLGFFREACKSSNWCAFKFNCEESPIVDIEWLTMMTKKYSREEDNFRVRILGEFPNEDAMDEGGWMPLISEADLEKSYVSVDTEFEAKRLGIDPAGSGSDKASWVGRNATTIKILHEEKISTPIGGAQQTVTLAKEHDVPGDEMFYDNFGEGANWGMFMRNAGKMTNGINTGNPSLSPDYMNLRAEGAWLLRKFIKQGGRLIKDDRWKELLGIRYRSTGKGQVQIMPKEMMKKKGIKSPNCFDAACLTFLEPLTTERLEESMNKEEDVNDDLLGTSGDDNHEIINPFGYNG